MPLFDALPWEWGVCSGREVEKDQRSCSWAELKDQMGPVPCRNLTVPPPPLSSTQKEKDDPAEPALPNRHLVDAMKGRVTNWEAVRTMAANIRSPHYKLRQFFDDCVKAFPELSLFFVGDSGDEFPQSSRLSRQTTSSGRASDDEYQRTIGALFVVYWSLRADGDGKAGFCFGVDQDWNNYDTAQIENWDMLGIEDPEKRQLFLTTMQWGLIEELVNCVCTCEERIVALLCLTAFHDIMKVELFLPSVLPEHAPYLGYAAGAKIHDHDNALAYVLEFFPEILPSFAGLPAGSQQAVLFTQSKMNFNHGHFVQAEAPPSALTSFKKHVVECAQSGQEGDDDNVALYFFHWFTDLAGAQATPLGGAEQIVLRFPQKVMLSFLWSIPCVRHLSHEDETTVMQRYLLARWQHEDGGEAPVGAHAVALLRLAVMAQAPSPAVVHQAFRKRPAPTLDILSTEMAYTGCASQLFTLGAQNATYQEQTGPAFLIYYGPALLQINRDKECLLEAALEALCDIYKVARILFPATTERVDKTVKVDIAPLKVQELDLVLEQAPRGYLWAMLQHSECEASVKLYPCGDVNEWNHTGTCYHVMEFQNVMRVLQDDSLRRTASW